MSSLLTQWTSAGDTKVPCVSVNSFGIKGEVVVSGAGVVSCNGALLSVCGEVAELPGVDATVLADAVAVLLASESDVGFVTTVVTVAFAGIIVATASETVTTGLVGVKRDPAWFVGIAADVRPDKLAASTSPFGSTGSVDLTGSVGAGAAGSVGAAGSIVAAGAAELVVSVS